MKKNDKKQIKKPNWIVYSIAFILAYPFVRLFFRVKVSRGDFKLPEGPVIVVCNHQSFMDFIHVLLSLYPRRFHGIVAQKYFFYPPMSWFLPLMGCIPKNLFEPDARAVINMIKVIKSGDSLLLFPEGRISTDGTYAGIHKATGKLIKKLGVPVISCTVEGAYVCMPFWRKGVRRGNLNVTFSNLISSEETKRLSVDEINTRIDDMLEKADTAPDKEQFYVFGNKRLIEGLESIIYFCPCCSEQFKMKTGGNRIWCTACKSEAAMDRYARLSSKQCLPKSVQEWYRLQAALEMQSLSENMEPIIIPVDLKIMSVTAGGLESCGRGKLSLDPKGWCYDGELNGEEVQKFFPIDTVPALPWDPDTNFQIYSDGKFHAFLPYENTGACLKYSILGECAYFRFASDVQITKPIIR